MADYSQNISNTVRCFGEGPSTKWGQTFGAGYTMTWGTSKWGEGSPMFFTVIKTISNSQSIDTSLVKSAGKSISESVVTTMDMGSETLKSGQWSYVFTSDTSEAENRDFATWTSATVTDATFTCQPAVSTSWTEV